MKKSEIRKDYLLDKYVIIAPRRSKRPEQIREASVVVTPVSPFTIDQVKKNLIIDSLGKGAHKIIVIKNIYSAVSLQNKKAYGSQEVIVDIQDPTIRQADFSEAHIISLLNMYSRRVKAMTTLPKMEYILCFKNEGAASGASIQHEHSQIFGSNFVSPEVLLEAATVKQYFQEHGTSFYSDLIKKEMKSQRRVYEDKYVAAFTPYASAYQYEIWIFTKRPVDNISALNKNEVAALAKVLKIILQKLKKLSLPYNYFTRQIISDKHQHFCLKIEPRASIWAGVELDSGLVINSVPPEEAAKYYRSK
jgi:UDPglucose--hexose-1-phosphate uridylyltransferase